VKKRGAVGGRSKWLKDLVDDGSGERFNEARKLRRGLKEPQQGGKVGCAFCVIFNKDGTCDVECGQTFLRASYSYEATREWISMSERSVVVKWEDGLEKNSEAKRPCEPFRMSSVRSCQCRLKGPGGCSLRVR
jgi:hypothetical protein